MSPAVNPARDREDAATVLERASDRVAASWARTGLARTARGQACSSTDTRAVRWSLMGAIHLELDNGRWGRHKEDRVYMLLLDALEAARPKWRDWHEQEGRKAREAVALANRAAKRLRKEQQP